LLELCEKKHLVQPHSDQKSVCLLQLLGLLAGQQ